MVLVAHKMQTSTHLQKGEMKNLFASDENNKSKSKKMRQSQVYEPNKINNMDQYQSEL